MDHIQQLHANWFANMYAHNYRLAQTYPGQKEKFLQRCETYLERWLQLTPPLTINQLLPA